jgi:pyrroline-5-carboxylate reductase
MSMALDRILIVGFGKMAQALVEGWLASGIPANRFAIYHPRRSEAPEGIAVHNQWPNEHFDAVLLAVKPQMLGDIAADLEPLVGPDTVLISVLAGVTLAGLAQKFPRAGAIARLMPNLAVALRKSANALAATGLDEAQRAELTRLASALGTAEWLENESHFNLVTALAGSGPGFVFRFIDALAGGAADLGLDRAQADRLAIAMVEGASELAASSEHSAADLASRVASKGGMTQKGLDVLDEGAALQKLLRQCLKAARDRGVEMAEMAGDKG